MTGPRVLIQLVRADFLERVRRGSFLVTLGFTLFAAWGFLPPDDARYETLDLGGHRGIYNSAWVGSLVAMLAASFLSLAGFYLVKNALERDRRTGVGQILAATPLPGPLYLMGKLASNFAVLATMVAVLAAVAAVMQLVRGEDPALRPLALVTPFLLVPLPVMALVASLAVCFEVAPALRGGGGNVVYFFLWTFGMSLIAARPGGLPDPLASEVLLGQMQAACAAAFPDYPGGRAFSMGINLKSPGEGSLTTFVWEGATWTPASVAGRAAWAAAAVVLTALVAPFFDRFDTSRAPAGEPSRGRRTALGAPAGTVRAGPDDAGSGADRGESGARDSMPGLLGQAAGRWRGAAFAQLGALVEHLGRAPLAVLGLAELRILLKGVSNWWSLVALGLAAASLLAPLPVVREFLAPTALVWPLLRWSPMGSRERRHRTGDLLFSAPRPVARLLVAQWLAGAALASGVESGALVRFALGGHWPSLAALLAAVGFVPALALAFGTWSGSGKLFEVLYLILWYVGPMHRVPALDYVGVTQQEAGLRPVAVVLLMTAGLLVLAVAGRRRELRR